MMQEAAERQSTLSKRIESWEKERDAIHKEHEHIKLLRDGALLLGKTIDILERFK